ncbi:MAG: hypothetical protein ACRC0G_07765 [Fusobacteriaceae bacterium]
MDELEFERYTERLEGELFKLPYANWQSNNTVVSVRCPFCGDSVKHYNSTHFGVHIPRDDEDVPWYHCFLCGVSGVVKGNELRDWGCTDSNLVNETNKLVKKNLKLSKNVKKFGYTKHNLPLYATMFPNDSNTISKLDYLNKRLGLNLNFKDLVSLKICLNIDEIIPDDVKPSRTNAELTLLADNYMGFVSFDNGYITFRRVTDNPKLKRYMIYNVFDKIDNSRKFYVLPTLVDTLKKVTINIAEGPMDILGIYFNVLDKAENNIYVAVNGADYRSVILYFMRLGYIDADFVIYSDNEDGTHSKDINYFKRLKKKIGEYRFASPLKIVYNVHGKTKGGKTDFGVPREQIQTEYTYL